MKNDEMNMLEMVFMELKRTGGRESGLRVRIKWCLWN